MDIGTIQVFASTYIYEQEIPAQVKCELIDFVKEADGDEILHLIFNGAKPDHALNDAERFVLRSQGEYHIYPLIMMEDTITFDFDGTMRVAGEKIKQATSAVGRGAKEVERFAKKYKKPSMRVGVTALLAAGAAASHEIYKRYLSQAARSCSGKNGMDKRNCMVAFRKKALQGKIVMLQKVSGNCTKTKNPGRCKKKFEAKIKKIRYRISILHSKY